MCACACFFFNIEKSKVSQFVRFVSLIGSIPALSNYVIFIDLAFDYGKTKLKLFFIPKETQQKFTKINNQQNQQTKEKKTFRQMNFRFILVAGISDPITTDDC